MEQQPLKEEPGSSPLSSGFKESGLTKDNSRIVNKRTIIVCGILIFVLLILVIVLGALLGVERQRNKGKYQQHSIWKIEHGSASDTRPHGAKRTEELYLTNE